MNSILKKSLFCLMILCFLAFAFSFMPKFSVKAAETGTAVYTIDSKTKVTATGDLPKTASATYSQTYNNAVGQMTSGNSTTLVLSGYTGKTISGIVLSMKSNASKGAGTLSITAGTTKLAEISTATAFNNWYDRTAYSSNYVDVNVTLLDSTYVIKESEDVTITIAATANSLYIASYTITYSPVEKNPSVQISSADNKTILFNDTTLAFSETISNIDPVSTKVWSSSNTEVATINNAGLLTPVANAVGTTDVKLTVNGTYESATKTITVFPNNANPIDCATALKVANVVGTTASTIKFTSIGTITYVDANNLTLTDATGSITVYSKAHGFTASDNGKKVSVYGAIVTFQETGEYQYATITRYYTVTFNANNGTSNSTQDVISGGKVSKPTDPVKTSNTFLGWYTSSDTAFDFETAITSDITLNAKWENPTLIALQNNLNGVKAFMSLAFKYEALDINNYSDTITFNDLTFVGTSYADFTYLSENGNYYKGNAYSANSDKVIQIRTSSSNSGFVVSSSYGNVIKVTITWAESTSSATNTGKAITIYGNNTAYNSSAELYTAACGTKLVEKLEYNNATNFVSEYVVDGSYKYIGIKSSSGAIYIKNIKIDYEKGKVCSDVNFKLKCAVDKSLATYVTSASGTSKEYGIMVTCGETTVKYPSTSKYFHVEEAIDGKLYVVVDLGDVINNPERLGKEFTVQAYATVDGNTVVSTSSKTYSVYSIVKTYNDNSEAGVSNFVKVLESYGYSFDK